MLLCKKETTELTVGSSMKTSVKFSVVIKKANRITGIIRKGTEEKNHKNSICLYLNPWFILMC